MNAFIGPLDAHDERCPACGLDPTDPTLHADGCPLIDTPEQFPPFGPWTCGSCGQETAVRHFLRRDGVVVHDPDAAYREAVGLDAPEPTPASANGVAIPEGQEQQ